MCAILCASADGSLQGDGAGVGKGRQIAALFKDHFRKKGGGNTRGLWVSVRLSMAPANHMACGSTLRQPRKPRQWRHVKRLRCMRYMANPHDHSTTKAPDPA